MEIRPFKTVHRIESFGYSLIGKNKKLKPEFAGKTSQEIQKMKSCGVKVDQLHEQILVSFAGDSEVEFLDQNPQTLKSKILFLECTYLDQRKTVEHAKKWGHTHLDEILSRLPLIDSEKIVLIHLSSRYRTEEALQILTERIPKEYQERVVLFPGR